MIKNIIMIKNYFFLLNISKKMTSNNNTNTTKIISSIPHDIIPIIVKDFLNKYGNKYIISGSYIRNSEFSSDIDILYFGVLSDIKDDNKFLSVSDGDKKISGYYTYKNNKYRLDIWFCDNWIYEPMLLYTSGPKNFSIVMRHKAKEKNLLLNQYGLFKLDNTLITNKSKTILEILGMKKEYINPENRNSYL